MMIKIAIAGYGNLGKSIRGLVEREEDFELVKIFTRRDPKSFNDHIFESLDNILNYKNDIDLVIMALGSAKDIPEIGPRLIKDFSTLDAYDNHKMIKSYFEKMDKIAKENQNVAFVSTGWDPGLFSFNRMMAEAIIKEGHTTTFWGRGVSQGHSDAVRRIEGVKFAVQYTIPNQEILKNIKNDLKDYKSYETHKREVFVVVDQDADKERIEREIKTMPDYFSDYETKVNFISEEEFKKDHNKMPHGGHVVRVGLGLDSHTQMISYNLDLDSNPDFTAAVCLASARAAYRFKKEKKFGAHTILDTPVNYFSSKSHIELIEEYL